MIPDDEGGGGASVEDVFGAVTIVLDGVEVEVLGVVLVFRVVGPEPGMHWPSIA